MSLEILIAAETHRLTTLEAILAEIQVDDQIIFAESLIDQASAAIARYLGMPLAQQKYREIGGINRTCPVVILSRRPLVRLDALSLQGVSLIDPSLQAYRVESFDVPALALRYGYGWVVGTGPGAWGGGYDGWYAPEIEATYVAGWILPEQNEPVDPSGPKLPDDLQRATIEACKIWFSERLVNERILSRSLGDQTIRYDLQSGARGLPRLTQDLLQPYRRVGVA